MAGTTPHPIHREARPPRPRRAAALLCALVIIPILVTATEAGAAPPTILLGVPRVGEFQPVRGDNFIAWQQNTRTHPGQYNVYARPLDGGEKFKVNPTGTHGAIGDIDGDVLVYQQFEGERSNLRFFDLVGRTHTNPPPGVNTDQWEYWPSMSGNWLLFGRLYDNGLRRIILFDLSTNTSRRLDSIRGAETFLAPGQVDGDYAVWSRCGSDKDCDVFRYHIPDATEAKIPNRGGRQHAPSVSPDGTVFFARSRAGCGTGARLIRRPLEGKAVVLVSLPGGDDIGSTRAYVNGNGVTTVAYDHFDCDEAAESDAWEVGEDFSPELTVKLEGNGAGTVTSSPAGIDCGTDCSESYEMGTGVTLTAEPRGDATFAGWSGACTGTQSTCTIQMNDSRTVTATFTNKPVLTVTKSGSGQGTVTSTPAGIDCGTDCNQPYDRGTNVTLTAEPNQNSTFGGWSGACGGNSTTCNIAMTDSKLVTATFTIKPKLTVVKSGTGGGSVTSSPSGINCGSDCEEFYETGTSVTLTATPNASSSFGGWSGACSGMSTTCNVTMNANRTATATFDAKPLLTVAISGSGSVTGTGINCPGDCTQAYDPGADVTLTAFPGSGSSFDSWTGCDTPSGNQCTMDMTVDKSVTATFTVDPVELTVSLGGDGSGTVTGSGINCPGDCTETYAPGTDVTLTATADLLTSTFTGWTDCDTPNGNECTMDMTTDKSVTASFDNSLSLVPSSPMMYEILLTKGLR